MDALLCSDTKLLIENQNECKDNMEVEQNHKSCKKKLIMDDEVDIINEPDNSFHALSTKKQQGSKDVIILDTNVMEEGIESTSILETSAKAKQNAEDVITLDSSEDLSVIVCNTDPNNVSMKNTTINLEETLPPGVAPKGYYITDEDYTQSDNVKDNTLLNPLLTIHFRSNNVVRQYRKKIENFLRDLITTSAKECHMKWADLVLEIWDKNIECKNSETCVDSSNNSKIEQSNDSLFMIDTQPKLKDDLDIPTYGKKFDKILEKSSAKPKETKKNLPARSMCFNCMGNHNLRDCTLPRNYNNIQKNRKDFNMKMGSKNARYHQDEDQKFGHLIPGQISKNLRYALGLKDHELPKHIYRMRTLGYPPGWLEEARLQHSGLFLFNSEGVAENDPEDEEGEIVCIENKDKYDIKKIIDYPGFNIHAQRGIHDECTQYWGSEMQILNSKSVMLSNLSNRKADEGYKRKKLKKVMSTSAHTKVVPSEMEIDDVEDVIVESVSINGLFIPPLPKEDIRQPDPPPPPPSEDSDSHSQEPLSPESVTGSTAPSSRAESPTLSDLEFTKKHILAELEDSSSQSNPDTPIKSDTLELAFTSTEMPPPGSDFTPQNNRTQSKQNTSVSRSGSVKSVDFGTPILKSASPFNKLPSSEKFSKNICDVINFENLPDATGKYEQMSGLIQKVRDKLAEIHKE